MADTEFIEVPEGEQLDSDPIGPSDANALEGGDDLDLLEGAFDVIGEVVTEDLG